MNSVDFTNISGFRATLKTWDFIQQNYLSAFGGIAKLLGEKVILTGVEVTGGTVSEGWIVYNGELIYFAESGTATDVIIETTAEQILLNDTEVPFDAYFTKTARCGAPGDFPFADLVRLETLRNAWLSKDVKEVDCDGAYITANFDGTGLGINERKGWAICNGNNGTRNRGGRVSVGYETVIIDPADNVWDALYNTIGSLGGEKKHQLTIAELASHFFFIANTTNTAGASALTAGNYLQYESNDNGDFKYTFKGSGSAPTIGKTNTVGSDTPHENRQPFIVTLFIQKL